VLGVGSEDEQEKPKRGERCAVAQAAPPVLTLTATLL